MSATPNNADNQQQPDVCIMTFAEYDDLLRQAVETKLYGPPPNWPSPSDIEEMQSQLSTKDIILMFSYLLEVNPAPITDAEQESRDAMKQFTYDRLKLVDDVAEPVRCVITFDEYDDFMQRASEIELYGLRPYWPSPAEIDQKGSHFPIYELVLMLSWLLEMNPNPVTEAEKISYTAMKQYVYEHLKIVDGTTKE